MEEIKTILKSHPEPASMDIDLLSDCIGDLFRCSQSSLVCADACSLERAEQGLIQVERLCLDCADICNVTGQVLLRQTAISWSPVRDQLESCITASRVCGDMCGKYADRFGFCKLCQENCRKVEMSCNLVIEAVYASV